MVLTIVGGLQLIIRGTPMYQGQGTPLFIYGTPPSENQWGGGYKN